MDNQIYRPPQTDLKRETQEGAPDYVRWMVRVAVLCIALLVLVGLCRFSLSMWLARGYGYHVHATEVWSLLLSSILPGLAVNVVLLAFILRYSRIAAGLLLLWEVVTIGRTLYLVVIHGVPFTASIVWFAVFRIALCLLALAGCLLYHAYATPRAGAKADQRGEQEEAQNSRRISHE